MEEDVACGLPKIDVAPPDVDGGAPVGAEVVAASLFPEVAFVPPKENAEEPPEVEPAAGVEAGLNPKPLVVPAPFSPNNDGADD